MPLSSLTTSSRPSDLYTVGEVDNGDVAINAPYQVQGALDGTLNYPMYWALRHVSILAPLSSTLWHRRQYPLLLFFGIQCHLSCSVTRPLTHLRIPHIAPLGLSREGEHVDNFSDLERGRLYLLGHVAPRYSCGSASLSIVAAQPALTLLMPPP